MGCRLSKKYERARGFVRKLQMESIDILYTCVGVGGQMSPKCVLSSSMYQCRLVGS